MIIKRYTSDKEYQREAAQMMKQGYKVAQMTSERPRAGCLRIILTGGLGVFLWPPKPQLVVTYIR